MIMMIAKICSSIHWTKDLVAYYTGACAPPSVFQAPLSVNVVNHVILPNDLSQHYPVAFNTKLTTVATKCFSVILIMHKIMKQNNIKFHLMPII